MVTGEQSKTVEDSVEDRRAGFVEQLLKADGSSSSAVVDATHSRQETIEKSDVKDTNSSKDSDADIIAESMFFHFSQVNFTVNFLSDLISFQM